MICGLRQIEASDITPLLANPSQVASLLFPDDDDDPDAGIQIELDKAWHGIHFLLTGSAWEGDEPLCYLVTGGEQIGEEDVGYGPARLLRPFKVATFAAALAKISPDDFRGRYNPEAMQTAEIYPDIWDRVEEREENLQYLLEYFEELKTFTATAHEQGTGLIIYLS